ncbi:MFS transporter [Cohnella sp. LGH]|uniref:MFS transporter n=1 Tax=Cohnella sp. LGH TaxID=1619153 RepID=UPI001ADA8BC6|nr:MFS transporter [Cohnella sp. LGH]QTH43821.1 MFS transporter [Cohnella sp. LGH]
MRFVFLLAALFLASLNLRPAISSVSPLLGTIRDSLGMSGSAASLLTSLPVLCMGLFAPAAVKLSSRWGIERTVAYSLLLIGAATAARYAASTEWLLLATALLAGVGIAVTGPLLSGFIKRHFANPSAIVGVYSMSLVIGAALGAWLAVPLQTAFDSWQASTASWAVLAFLALFFWWRPAKSALPAGEAANTRSKAGAGSDAKSHGRALLRSKRAWLLTAFFGIMAIMFYSMTAWLAPIVEEMGFDRQTAASVLTLFTLIQIPVSLLIPLLIGRYGRKAVWLVACSALELIGLLLLLAHASPWLIAILLGIGAGGLFPIALMLPIDESGSAEEASALSAMTQSGGYTIASLGPLFVGVVHDVADSYVPAIAGLAALVVVMMIIQLSIGRKSAVRPLTAKRAI